MKIKFKLMVLYLLVWPIDKYYKKFNLSYIVHKYKYSQITYYHMTYKIKNEKLSKTCIISYYKKIYFTFYFSL